MALKQGFFVFLATMIVVATYLQFAAHTAKETDALLEHGPTTNRDDAPRGVYFIVYAVRGEREATHPNEPLDTLWVQVALSPRASEANLSRLALEISDGALHRPLHYTPGEAKEGKFAALVLRDSDRTFHPHAPVMTRSDLIQLKIDLKENDLPLEPRQALFLEFTYDKATDLLVDLHTPPGYGDNKVIRLL